MLNENTMTGIAMCCGALVVLFGSDINSGLAGINEGVLHSLHSASDAIASLSCLIDSIKEYFH